MNQTKICTKCNTQKELFNFSKQNASKDGFRADCKQCCAEYNKQYHQANEEAEKERCKQYRQNNQVYFAEYGKQYRQDNKDSIAEREKQYRLNNKEYYTEYNKQWRQDNKQYIAERYKRWCQENKEQIAKQKKQWRENNPDKIAEQRKQYRQTPKGKAIVKASQHNYYAKRRKNGGKITANEILNLFDLQNGKCVYCECKLHKSGHSKYEIDHIYPVSKGGANTIENAQLLCKSCNRKKSNKLPEEFAAQFNKLF